MSTDGSYYCRVTHGTTLIKSCPARVSIATFKPPLDSDDTEMVVHRTNDVVLSSCQHVHSIPPPDITWKFDDGSLHSSAFILPSGNLLISDFKYGKHLGKYHCVASNPVTKEEWRSPTTDVKRTHASKLSLAVERMCLVIKCRCLTLQCKH